MDKLTEIMQKQLELQKRLGTDFSNLTDKERAEFMRNHRGYLEDELAEAFYEMPNYKLWKDYSNMNEEARNIAWQKVRMELIDCLHFFANLLLCAGMTPDEVHDMYMAKNKENHRRQDAGYTSDVSYRDQSVEEVMSSSCTVSRPGATVNSNDFIALLFSTDSCDVALNTSIVGMGIAASILQERYSTELANIPDADRIVVEENVADAFNKFMEVANEKD